MGTTGRTGTGDGLRLLVLGHTISSLHRGQAFRAREFLPSPGPSCLGLEIVFAARGRRLRRLRGAQAMRKHGRLLPSSGQGFRAREFLPSPGPNGLGIKIVLAARAAARRR